MLTPSQTQASISPNSLLDTVIDCLYFVTEFFEVIRQSGPHIYHSGLQFISPSSMVRKLYIQQTNPPVSKVVTGVTVSEDSCIASIAVDSLRGIPRGVWSPCGQFIAAYNEFGVAPVEIRDPNTLEMVSTLKPPVDDFGYDCGSITFSAEGKLLACAYWG